MKTVSYAGFIDWSIYMLDFIVCMDWFI